MRLLNRLIAYLVAGMLAVLITGSISERLVSYQDREAVLIFALVLGAINAYIRPIVRLLTLPLTCLTFGLFALVLNVALFAIAVAIVPGIEATFWGLVLGAMITSMLSGVMYTVLDER